MATNSLSFLSEADHILLIENGEIIEAGSYNELIKNINGSFSRFIKFNLGNQKINQGFY